MNLLLEPLKALAEKLEGELFTDDALRILYATDASAYSEMPLAVAMPRSCSGWKG